MRAVVAEIAEYLDSRQGQTRLAFDCWYRERGR